MIENVLCNKNKNASVRFFICMSSMCVQLFTAFEEPVLRLYLLCTLVTALKSKMAVISIETKCGKKMILFFPPYFFILINHNKMYNEMIGLKNEQNSFSTSTSPQKVCTSRKK